MHLDLQSLCAVTDSINRYYLGMAKIPYVYENFPAPQMINLTQAIYSLLYLLEKFSVHHENV